MTFTDWYDSSVKPQLEETLKGLPVVAREALRTASRQAMASCWNAALDAAASPQLPADAQDYATHIYSLRVAS